MAADKYDVFLSHASTDKESVETLARRLRDEGLDPFLDKWHLVPGEPWQEGLEDALEASRTCAVFIGKKLGPWQNEEMRDALDERVHDAGFRVIPVLLPGARMPGRKHLPRFLRRLTWIDFRQGLCSHLEGSSLLLDLDVARATIRLHDVIRQYLIGEHADLPALHRRLLERCRPPSGRWTDLAAGETYLWRHLAYHLAGADDRAELRLLLFDLDYFEGKLRTVGVNGLLADYDVLGEAGEARKVQKALRLSAHLLARDWGGLLSQQLAGQLLGRLDPVGEDGRRLLRKAAERVPLRPRHVTMSRTGGPLIRTLEGHTGGVHAVAVLDGQRVVSASSDRTLWVWDVESGQTLRTLADHTDWVRAVAVLDGQRVVSASSDSTLRVWDVESGQALRTHEGHTDWVRAVVVLDGQRVVSASDDRALRVWDVESGETMALFVLDAPLWAVAVTADGRTVVAGDAVGGVHFLDLDLF